MAFYFVLSFLLVEKCPVHFEGISEIYSENQERKRLFLLAGFTSIYTDYGYWLTSDQYSIHVKKANPMNAVKNFDVCEKMK